MKTLDRSRFAAPGLRLPRKAGFRAAAAVAAGSLLLASAGVAYADIIANDLDVTADSTAEVMPLNVGGLDGITTLALTPTNDDGDKGCNLPGQTTLKLNIISSTPSVATVSPSIVTFTSCGFEQPLTITPVGEGFTNITASIASSDAAGTFNLDPAAFRVNVGAPAPSNSAPILTLSGATLGGSYAKGLVPATLCQVNDKEDGSSTFDAELSAITGPAAVDGVGSQTATCTYMDKGGLIATSSVTYSIYDATEPVIRYTLSPTAADGLAGWYKTAVSLDWTVIEEDSPSTLVLTGCEDQTISADQALVDYTCSATSLGGSAEEVTVSLKKDGTAPEVAYDSSKTAAPNANGWYNTNVVATFTATDNFSGPLVAFGTATSSGESANESDPVEVASPAFQDLAGNVRPAGAVTASFNIDWTPPTAKFSALLPDSYYGFVPAPPTCEASDSLSGLDGTCLVEGYSTEKGIHTLTATAKDKAGNTTTITDMYEVKAWTIKGFYQPIDMGKDIYNTVKGGSTVPAKFEVFAGSRELTDPSLLSFSAVAIQCTSQLTDDIEVIATGNTALRYDTTAGQFVYNWKTPTGAGKCYQLILTAADGSSISANFKLK